MFATQRVSKVGMLVAGVALGWSAGAKAQPPAGAGPEVRAAVARQQANAARHRATELARAGGWAYKAGLVGQAQRDAARYQEEADRAAAAAQACPASPPPTSAEVGALARVEQLRSAGGWAYKTGAVARAERDAQAQATVEGAQPVAPSPEQTAALSRLEELRRAGAWAYKTGAVARAEREVEAQAAPRPVSACEGRGTLLTSSI